MSCVGHNRQWSDVVKDEKRANRKVWLGVGIGIALWVIAAVGLFSREHPSRIVDAIGIAESIRGAFAAYAGKSANHVVPTAESLRDYTTLRAMVNQYGGRLRATEESMGIRFESYETQDTNHDGVPDDYILLLSVPGIPHRDAGQRLRITSAGIEKLEQR